MRQLLTLRKTLGWLAITAMALSGAAVGMAAENTEAEAIVVNKSPSMVTFVGGTTKASGRLKVRVAGPGGETVYESTSEAGIVDWVIDPNLPDGNYRWDAWFVPNTEFDRIRKSRAPHGSDQMPTQYRSGVFRIKSGLLVHPNNNSRDKEEAQLGWVERAVGQFLDRLVPLAHAGVTHGSNHVLIEGPNPSVQTDDTATDGGLDWVLSMTALEFGVIDQHGDASRPLVIQHEVPDNALFLEENTGHVGLGTPNPAVPLHIADTTPRLRFEDTDGFGSSGPTAWTISASSDEFRLQDNDGGGRPIVVDAGGDSGGAPTNSLFIAADGDIGLGTSTPESDLHVVGSGGSLMLEGTSAPRKWLHFVAGGGGDYLLQDRGTFSIPFIVSAGAPTASIDVAANGNVGMGTTSPAAPLHVQRSDGSAQVLVEDTDTSDTGPLQMFKLLNHGFPAFNLQDTSQPDVRWTFRISGTQDNDERFVITKLGTGQPEFALFADGSAEFQGDVTANGVVLDSSREVKTDFSPVDEHTVLKKVASLDVSQWRYKQEPDTERHIGPMAEDFRELFGLGDGKHISVGDANGILFAAAKALKQENEALRGELAALKSAVAELQAGSE